MQESRLVNVTQSRLENTARQDKWVDISPPRDLYGVNMSKNDNPIGLRKFMPSHLSESQLPGGVSTSRPKPGAREHASEYDKSAYTYAAGASNQIGNRPGVSPQSHL